jgi:hypothetical protein
MQVDGLHRENGRFGNDSVFHASGTDRFGSGEYIPNTFKGLDSQTAISAPTDIKGHFGGATNRKGRADLVDGGNCPHGRFLSY